VPDLPVVCLVDDDESVRIATSKLLKLNGYAVQTFGSAEECLGSSDLAKARCLITDLVMPGMSGLALQERLLAEGHQIPVIFISAHAEEQNRERALAAGAIAFLSKPFDEQALKRVVEQALGK
jgi:FixJ family two-component response regulator